MVQLKLGRGAAAALRDSVDPLQMVSGTVDASSAKLCFSQILPLLLGTHASIRPCSLSERFPAMAHYVAHPERRCHKTARSST